MTQRAQTISEKMIKVDHVGENGAVHIYRAQRWVAKLRAPRLIPEIEHFIHHEETHRQIFKEYLSSNDIRKCVSYHFGGIGGTLLGLITGMIGTSAIHATTYAVESVVLSHLEEQLAFLKTNDTQAYACVLEIYADEKEHLAYATSRLDTSNKLTQPLIHIIKFSTELVIKFGMR
ncbi:MAG: demethoxyubiquinone hydroxylase family protein [Robiginitomaculum sp.]|nr:demethoxyubiquinone hydroxylase family protein [Robiginitomaculum sp.]